MEGRHDSLPSGLACAAAIHVEAVADIAVHERTASCLLSSLLDSGTQRAYVADRGSREAIPRTAPQPLMKEPWAVPTLAVPGLRLWPGQRCRHTLRSTTTAVAA